MAKKPARMADDDLLAILRKEEGAASAYQTSSLSAHREASLNYYDRKPYGDEQEGSSQVVTSEYADTIEAIMPSMMRIFAGTDNVAEFAPSQPGEEQWSKEANDYVPHVLMHKNEGFRLLHGLIKDALMFRLAALTVDVEQDDDKRVVEVEGLTQDAIDLIVSEAQAKGAELTMDLTGDPAAASIANEQQAYEQEGAYEFVEPAETFSGTITVTHKRKRVEIENIAPEDVLFTPTVRIQDKASFQGFRKRTTASELIELGLSQEEVDELRSDRDTSVEDGQRNDSASLNEPERNSDGDSERPLWLVLAYVKADFDGDGKSEMERVLYAHAGGMAGQIIDRMEWDEIAPIVLATPILRSHTLVGTSIFDQVKELQEIGSALTRGMLNNLYMVNTPRPVVSDQVNLDTLIDWVPGSPIRLKANARPQDGHVSWLQVPSVGPAILAAMEYMATVRENRTGVARNTQGIEGDTLQNKTLGGLNLLMGAAQQRLELIARTFAETAIKRLFTLIYLAIKRAASGEVTYWVGREFRRCDPTKWPDEMALSVNVGSGSRDQALQHLMVVEGGQEKLIALQGGKAEGPFVTKENVANLAQKLTETLGYKTPGMFFEPPEKVAAQPAQPAQQPQMSPELMTAQAQIEILRQAAEAEVAIKREKAQADIAIANFKARQWAEIERYKAGLSAQIDDRELERKSHLRGLEIVADAHVEAARQPNGSMPQ